jgi:hypothetical protein
MKPAAGLLGFITIMWIMILAAAAFLVIIIGPMDQILFHNGASREMVSIIQASISITVVIMLILFLSRFKMLYVKMNIKT